MKTSKVLQWGIRGWFPDEMDVFSAVPKGTEPLKNTKIVTP